MTTTKTTDPAGNAPTGKRTKKILLAFAITPFVVLVIAGLVNKHKGYNISSSISNEARTDKDRVVLTSECYKDDGKVSIGKTELKVTAKTKIDHTVYLTYGENEIPVKISCGEKTGEEYFSFYRKTQKEIQSDKNTEFEISCKNRPHANIDIVNHNWSKAGFGSVAEHSIVLRNSCPKAVKDIELSIEYIAPSGSVVGSNSKTLFDIIPGKSSKAFNFSNLVHSQAKSVSVSVIDAKSIN